MTDNWKTNGGQKIDRLYAWTALDPDDNGGEGIIGGPVGPGGMQVPLIGADKARMESYRPVAEMIADALGVTVRLKVFGQGVVIDEIERPA
jgi:hypothetical protein